MVLKEEAIVICEPAELYVIAVGGLTNPAFVTNDAEQSTGFAVMVMRSLVNKTGVADNGITIPHSRQNVKE